MTRRFGIAFKISDAIDTRDYTSFFAALHAASASKAHSVMPGYHIATSEMTASELRDLLKRFLFADDSLFIHEIGSWASFRTKATPRDLVD